jgi:hypothetical protein
MWFGQIRLDASDKISPGETREVLIQFNAALALLAELNPGRIWRIQDGPQLVATAKVIEVLGGTQQSVRATAGSHLRRAKASSAKQPFATGNNGSSLTVGGHRPNRRCQIRQFRVE